MKVTVIAIAGALLASLAAAQTVGGPMTCNVTAGVPVLVRPLPAQLTSDIVMTCTGGNPAAPFMPTFTLFLNTPITGRGALNESEAQLLVDEPGLPADPGWIRTPGTFQASRTGQSNSITWTGVTVTPPGNGLRIFRFSNLWADAAAIGVGSVSLPNQIIAFVSVSSGGALAVDNPQHTVAFIAHSRHRPGVYNPSLSRWTLDTPGGSPTNVQWGTSASVPVPGQWHNAARVVGTAYNEGTRPGVYNNGVWYLDSNGSGQWDAGDRAIQWGGPGATPVTGDWNADGRTEIGVYVNGIWYLDMNDSGSWDAEDRAVAWGVTGATPIVGDWNGDGRSDIGVVLNGVWYLDYNGSFSFDAGDRIFQWGTAADRIVLGDWNGNGRTKAGAVSNGVWYLDSNGDSTWNAGDEAINWGFTTATPVSGDWNGDGKDDPGVFDAGTWRLDTDGNHQRTGADTTRTFGTAGDTPIAIR